MAVGGGSTTLCPSATCFLFLLDPEGRHRPTLDVVVERGILSHGSMEHGSLTLTAISILEVRLGNVGIWEYMGLFFGCGGDIHSLLFLLSPLVA